MDVDRVKRGEAGGLGYGGVEVGGGYTCPEAIASAPERGLTPAFSEQICVQMGV